MITSPTSLFGPLLAIVALAIIVISAITYAIYHYAPKKGGSKQSTSMASPAVRFLLTLSTDALIVTDTKFTVLNYNAALRELLATDIILNNQHFEELCKMASPDGNPLKVDSLTNFKDANAATHTDLFIVNSKNQRLQVDVMVYKMHPEPTTTVYIWKFSNKSKIAEQEQEQSEFISVISHELRTPVAVMEASTSTLLNNTTESLSPAQQKLVNATRENALLLSKLLADLSVYSKLRVGTITTNMSSVSPRMILDQMQKVSTTQADSKNIVLVVDHDQNVRNVISEEAHILSILQNYIKNAIQFSNPGGIVILATKAVSDGVIFMIRDSGVGIDQDSQAHIFENTFHAHSDTQHQTLQGAGVGLYISGQLAKSIGATVWVESEPGKGSSFYLKVPTSYATTESKQEVHGLELNKFAQDI